MLRYSFQARDRETYQTTGWTGTFQAKWNDIFAAIAPLMINEVSDTALKDDWTNLSELFGSQS